MRGPLASGRLRRGRGEQARSKQVASGRQDEPRSRCRRSPSPAAELAVRAAAGAPTHYHGVLAPAIRGGRAWSPRKRRRNTKPPLPGLRVHGSISWADLLRRVYSDRDLVCLCGGQRRIVAQIDEGPMARKILAHLGLPTEPPVPAPARLPEQLDAWDTGPPRTTEPEAPECDEQPPPTDFDQRIPGSDLFA